MWFGSRSYAIQVGSPKLYYADQHKNTSSASAFHINFLNDVLGESFIDYLNTRKYY